jgi:hypothetical protein
MALASRQVTTATVVIDATEVTSIKFELHTVTSSNQAACSEAIKTSQVAKAGGKCTGPDADHGTYYKVGRCKLKPVLNAPGSSAWKLTFDQFRERRFRVYTKAPGFHPGPRQRETLPRVYGGIRLSLWPP